MTSFDEVVLALFLQAPGLKTMPVQMYNAIALDIDPTISAASSIVVVFTTLLLLVPQLYIRSKRVPSDCVGPFKFAAAS